MTNDVIEKFLHEEGLIRASVIKCTEVVEVMRKTHNTFDLATVVLGRTMVGALLMASHLKKGESVGVYIRGNGPLGTVFAEGDHEGSTRAYTANPQIQLPLKNNKLDISGAVGIGIMEVIRGNNWSDFTQKGAVELQTGQVGDDIAYYLYQSHQIPSIVGLSVELNRDGTVKFAGGILIELMPGANEGVIEKIEDRMRSIRSLSKMFQENCSLKEIMEEYLGDFSMIAMPHQVDIQYNCRCSKEKVKNVLFLIGYQQLDEMIQDEKDSEEISCDFCGKKYTLTLGEIKEIRANAFRNSLN